MILRDWREASPALMRACYDREQRSWQDDLAWDTTWTWNTVEQARVSWGLPGLLACADDGTLLGWAFAMRDGGALHVGGLVASSADATAALLDGILEDPAAAAGVACFVRDRAPGVAEALTARGLEVERFHYLHRPLVDGDIPVDTEPRPSHEWRDADFLDAARLLQMSYSPSAGRHFAPSGTLTEWAKYLSGVVQQAGCGLLDRGATRVARDADRLQGLALVTAIGPGTMHVAQLAVHPRQRGRGMATRLLQDAIACSAARAGTSMTLLVGEHNPGARRLYASLGFAERATFVAARSVTRPEVVAPASQREFLTQSVC